MAWGARNLMSTQVRRSRTSGGVPFRSAGAALLEDEPLRGSSSCRRRSRRTSRPSANIDSTRRRRGTADGVDGVETYAAPLSVDADARNAADAADASLLIARERDVWLKLDELLRRLSSVSPTAVPVPSQILGLLPPDGDWPEDFTLTAVAAAARAANVAPPDPFNRRYTTPPGGYPAHRRAARLSYAVWAVVGGAAQPVLDARTTAERPLWRFGGRRCVMGWRRRVVKLPGQCDDVARRLPRRANPAGSEGRSLRERERAELGAEKQRERRAPERHLARREDPLPVRGRRAWARAWSSPAPLDRRPTGRRRRARRPDWRMSAAPSSSANFWRMSLTATATRSDARRLNSARSLPPGDSVAASSSSGAGVGAPPSLSRLWSVSTRSRSTFRYGDAAGVGEPRPQLCPAGRAPIFFQPCRWIRASAALGWRASLGPAQAP